MLLAIPMPAAVMKLTWKVIVVIAVVVQVFAIFLVVQSCLEYGSTNAGVDHVCDRPMVTASGHLDGRLKERHKYCP